jgi:hypothetical protein
VASIAFKCPGCARTIHVPHDYAGRRGKCPACRTVVVVPDATTAAAQTPPSSEPSDRTASADRTAHRIPTSALWKRPWVVGGTLVGLVILGVLAMAIPRLGRGPTFRDPRTGTVLTLEHGKRLACVHNLVNIDHSRRTHADRHGFVPRPKSDEFAVLQHIVDSVDPHSIEPSSFVCPFSDQKAAPREGDRGHFRLNGNTCSYRWSPHGIGPEAVGTKESRRILAYDHESHPDGRRSALFTDGSIRQIDDEELETELKKPPPVPEDRTSAQPTGNAQTRPR